ncbi:DotA/TraY family protein [Ralstonia sp. ASV6]|uniref:DotA/TraY family protein n=1 Tax=Ralstonia sp. ASV6 TaxID=2795124 RepID=UPI0034D2ABD7
MGYLQMIFGDVITNIVSGMSPSTAGTAPAAMLGEAFRYFNSGVLVFGTFILTWVTIFGIQNSANDGEILGRQWNTFYTPIRTVAAAGMLVPTSSGYAFIQLVLLTLVTWSIGFASNIWTAVVKKSIADDVTTAAVSSIRADPNFAANMVFAIRMGACAAGVNSALQSTAPDQNIQLTLQQDEKQEQSLINTSFGPTLVTRIYYADPKWPGSESICGQMTITDTTSLYSGYTRGLNGALLGKDDGFTILRQRVADARKAYFSTLAEKTVPMVVDSIKSVAASTSNDQLVASRLSDLIASSAADFNRNLTDQVTQTVNSNGSKFIDSMTGQGWIYAASYWTNLARIKDVVADATKSKVSLVNGSNSLESVLPPGTSLTAANTVLLSIQSLADQFTQAALATPPSAGAGGSTTNSCSATPGNVQTSFTLNDFASGSGTLTGTFAHWFNGISTGVLRGMVCYLGEGTEDPVMQVKNIGDWMSDFAGAVFLTKGIAVSGLEGFSAWAQSSSAPGSSIAAGFAKGLVTWLAEMWSIIAPSLWTLMYLGYFLGIWIPMVPYYVFAVGVVGWMAFVIEMMAAGVLWAAAHTTPARDNSFIGSQMQGYMLVMSGFFRPALMVIGLVASNAMLQPALRFINGSFMTRVQALQHDSMLGLLALAGYMVVYTFIVSATFMLVFGLPQTLPDRILRWIGAGIGDLGEQGTVNKIEGQASGAARGAMLTGMNKQNAADTAKANQAAKDAAAVEKAREKADDRAFMRELYRGGQVAAEAPVTDSGQGPVRL